MISHEKALSIVLEKSSRAGTERVYLDQALGRTLAMDAVSDMDMPPFDKSAMDGFACKSKDIYAPLKVIETITAGKHATRSISQGECIRIMTGAPVPEGADCVIKVEETEMIDDSHIRFTGETTYHNICFRGEDIQKGAAVIPDGTLLMPQHIAVLASTGNHHPLVSKKVRVGIITTGDEIVEPGITPGISQIRNSNGPQLVAQIQKCHAIPNYAGIAPDNKEQTLLMISETIKQNDIVLLTGGVSMGDFDFVPEVLREAGVSLHFETIAVQPGKPTVFGTSGDRYIFGLPGNPVSSFIQFEMLVKPLIFKLSGTRYDVPLIKLPMGKTYQRKKSARKSIIPVVLGDDGRIYPAEYHGSAHINSLITAFGLIEIPVGVTGITEGELIYVRQI